MFLNVFLVCKNLVSVKITYICKLFLVSFIVKGASFMLSFLKFNWLKAKRLMYFLVE